MNLIRLNRNEILIRAEIMSTGSAEELVESITLYKPKPLLFHGYVGPFIILHGIWAIICSSWGESQEGEEDNSYEASLIGFAVILIVQTLVYLCCHWSVHISSLLTCTPVSMR